MAFPPGRRPDDQSLRQERDPSRIVRAGILLPLLLLTGCVGITIDNADGERQRFSRQEFRDYTQAVFRRQNALVGEVILLAEDMLDADPAQMRAVYEAEDAMNAACEPLNRLVARIRDGSNVRIDERLDIVPTVPRCDAAARRLEALLASMAPY